jgi:DNA-binding transcriptional LysR family regulator
MWLRKMELRQIRYFAATARRGGIRQGAEELAVSPGTVSEQIKLLEAELGVRLFDRSRRSLTLTEAGAAFLRRADQGLLAFKMAREEMLDFAHLERGHLLVGALPGLGPFGLTRFLVDFLTQYPQVDLHLIERASQVLLNLVASGELHAACVLVPGTGDEVPYGVSVRRLITAPLAVVVSPAHPFARQQTVSLEDLAAERLIVASLEETPRGIVDAAFRASGLEPDVYFEANDLITLIELAAAGVGVGITGQRIGRDHADKVATVPIAGPPLTYSLCVVWPADLGPQTRARQAFISFVADHWHDRVDMAAALEPAQA